MFLPLRLLIGLFRWKRPCTHCRAMNPDELAWKDCCKLDVVRYKCCECGRTKEWL